MGDASLTAAQKRQLREEDNKQRLSDFASRFHTAVRESELPAMRVKTQYPAYITAGMLHLLKEVAEFEEISVQELIRQCLQEGLERRMRKVPRKKKPEGSSKTKRAS